MVMMVCYGDDDGDDDDDDIGDVMQGVNQLNKSAAIFF